MSAEVNKSSKFRRFELPAQDRKVNSSELRVISFLSADSDRVARNALKISRYFCGANSCSL
jgi:hypothetical protein